MSTATATDTRTPASYIPSAETLAAVMAPGARPPRPSPLAASLAFGWRAMLKIKHVPEQLFDVTAFPIIMTLLSPTCSAAPWPARPASTSSTCCRASW
jgi:ABC-2 type transport system permease protein